MSGPDIAIGVLILFAVVLGVVIYSKKRGSGSGSGSGGGTRRDTHLK